MVKMKRKFPYKELVKLGKSNKTAEKVANALSLRKRWPGTRGDELRLCYFLKEVGDVPREEFHEVMQALHDMKAGKVTLGGFGKPTHFTPYFHPKSIGIAMGGKQVPLQAPVKPVKKTATVAEAKGIDERRVGLRSEKQMKIVLPSGLEIEVPEGMSLTEFAKELSNAVA